MRSSNHRLWPRERERSCLINGQRRQRQLREEERKGRTRRGQSHWGERGEGEGASLAASGGDGCCSISIKLLHRWRQLLVDPSQSRRRRRGSSRSIGTAMEDGGEMAANEAGTAVGDSVLLAEEGSRKRTMAAEAREEYDDDDDLGTFGDGANAPFSLPSRTLSLSLYWERWRENRREREEREEGRRVRTKYGVHFCFCHVSETTHLYCRRT